MKLIHEIERRIEERLRRLFADSGEPSEAITSSGPELIEIQKQVLDAVLDKVQFLPRARRVFPFNDVVVRIPASDPDRRALLEAVFISEGALSHEIREQLDREEIEYPRDLHISVQLLDTYELKAPSLICRRTGRGPAPESISEQPQTPVLRKIRWTLSNGSAVVSQGQRIHLGRTAEVFDDRKRLVRRNDVVAAGDTVSRAHAHVEFDAASGDYRVFDDGSTYGTSVLHKGRLVDLAKSGARGFALSPGDELYLGRERIRFELD